MATLPARTRTRTRRPWRCTHHTSAVPRGQADNNTLTPYRLYQTVISPSETDEELEGNDTLSTATPLVAPLMSGRVGDGDSDHFSLFAAAGTEIVVMADDDPDDDGARTNMLIELLDSSGTVLASSGEQALVPVTAPASDNYFVRITKSGGTEEDYRLVAKTYDPQPHDPTTLEATNAFSGPGIDKFFVTPSAVESPFEVETTIRINGDAPASNPGDVLAVDLRGVSGAEVPHPGSTAGSIPSLTHETIVYRNIEQLIVTDSREDNDSQDSATVLGSLKRITLNELSIDTMEDVDWFQYTAPDTGKLIINAHFATVAMDGGESPMGDLDLFVHDGDGNMIASSVSSTDDEKIVLPVVSQERYFIRLQESTATDVNNYDLEIENFEAPVPNFIGLDSADDSGISNRDRVTNEDEPLVIVEADLTNFDQMGVAILETATATAGGTAGAALEVFVNGNSIGFADPVTGTNSDIFSIELGAGDLVEGDNLVKAAVRIFDGQTPAATDRSPLSEPLVIRLDTSGPIPSFGDPTIVDDGLHPDSDTGIPTKPDLQVDRITSDTTPRFFGQSEAGSVVRAFVVVDDLGTADPSDDVLVEIGQALANPHNGDQGPGFFELTSEIDLTDPALGLGDGGERVIRITSEDPAGNIGEEFDELTIFLDPFGPQVFDVFLPVDEDYDLFDPKASVDGPTPPVDSITVTFTDLPQRTGDFLYPAVNEMLATMLGNYKLVGDHNGEILIEDVIYEDFTVPGGGEGLTVKTNVTLLFDELLPDDRYTLTVRDNISDNGDFVARFTVDSRPEFATYSAGTVYADINGNFVYDPEGKNNDRTNRDLNFHTTGITGYAFFAGDFTASGAATSSGFDKLGAFGVNSAGNYEFRLDFNHDGVLQFSTVSNVGDSAAPVAGDFFTGKAGEEIGLFDGTRWILDTDGDNMIDVTTDLIIPTSMRGQPIVGDFNGDGMDDLATYDSAQNLFQFDTDLDGTPDSTIVFGHSGFTERPVAGDFNLDGIDDIGLWVGGRQGQLPKEAGEWFLLLSDQLDDDPGIVFDAFSPTPLGNDVHAQFGDETALPLFANLDPPVSGGGVAIPDPLEATGTWQNLSIPARPLIARRRRMSATTIRTTSVERHIRPARSLPLSRANTRRGAATQQPYLSILG